jgi:hypothetical protein
MGRTDALSLARQLLRASRSFPDYNMRECVHGHVRPSLRRRCGGACRCGID